MTPKVPPYPAGRDLLAGKTVLITAAAGTGIGLNLAKTLVEMHGGTVSVESQKGEGSTFTIRLPIAGPDQSQQAETKVA